jgi:hypothetical protein
MAWATGYERIFLTAPVSEAAAGATARSSPSQPIIAEHRKPTNVFIPVSSSSFEVVEGDRWRSRKGSE